MDRLRQHAGIDTKWLARTLLQLLYEARRGDPNELATLAMQSVEAARTASDARRERDYLGLVAKFHARAGDGAAAEDAREAIVLSHISEAEAADTQGGGMLSHHLWENALKGARERKRLRESVPELQRRLAGAGRETLKNMSSFEHSIDVSDLVEDVRRRIEGKALDEAYGGNGNG